MPYIIKNGLTYTGNLMPITQAQYDALSEAEKNNGIAYFIVDSDAVLDASDVGLGEGNVEDLAGSVATIETSPTVTNHVVGEHILWNGQLYEVISAIGAGADLTVNTNISATSVGEELSELKNGLTAYTDGDWKVRKYPDGTAECWLRKEYQAISGQQVAGLGWYYYIVPDIYFPSSLFISTPTINADCSSWGTGVFWGSPRGTTKNSSAFTVFRNNAGSDNLAINVHAIGRWK